MDCPPEQGTDRFHENFIDILIAFLGPRGNSMKTGKLLLGGVMLISGCVTGTDVTAGLDRGDFETNYNLVEAVAPTQNMPTSLNASYVGQVKLGVNSGTSAIFGAEVDPILAEILGDLEIDVAWTEGMVTNPFSGTARNFTATESGTANTIAIAGTLNVDPNLPGSVTRVSQASQVIAGQTVPAIDTGAFQYTMTGRLGAAGQQGDVTLLFAGNFIGDAGASMLGAASGGVKDANSTNANLFDAGLGGVFYLNQ